MPPENKYASEGGPRFKDCFDLIRRACTTPATTILRLLDAAIFNVVLGNADAHGKNFSLLYAGGKLHLARLYDLLCTVVYPGLSPKFAMKIAKRATLEDFRGPVLPFDSEAATIYARLASTRRRDSTPISFADAQIPAITQSRGGRLATRNIRDFSSCGIEIVNPWDG